MKGQEITYTQIEEFTYPNAIVRVYKPDLTEEERASRMKLIHRAAESIVKEAIRVKGEKNSGN